MRTADEVALELAVERTWRTEKREGVEHFMPGQIVAEPARDDVHGRVLVLVWTAPTGHHVCVTAVKRNGEAFVPVERGYLRVSGATGAHMAPLPAGWMPSRKMEELLRAADESGGRVEFEGHSWMNGGERDGSR